MEVREKMEFWEELEIKVELYRNNRKEMIMNDILEFCCKYLKTCAMNSYNKAKNTIDYCHAFVPLMPTFLPLFATECTTLCQLDVPFKKYPITTGI